jgi:phosphoglycolate phosphatase
VSGGAILFDFDGTLVDTREASWELFAQTNEQFGLGVDTRERFFDIFQGNFHDSFEALSPDEDLIRRAKAHFMALHRERYRPRLIPGIVDVIKALSPAFTLAIVSSNATPVIRRCLQEADVATCFAHVFAGDVERSKSTVIERFMADQGYATLRHCAPAYVDGGGNRAPLAVDNVFIVTDTVGDVEEAIRVGIRAVGVCWGMHDEDSLLDAGAEAVMLWPQELIAFFGTAGAEAPVTCRVPASPPAGSPSGECSCRTSSSSEQRRAVRADARARTRRVARDRDPAELPADRSLGPPISARPRSVERELVEALTHTAVPRPGHRTN